MLHATLALLALTVLPAAESPKDAAKKDLDRLQGEWTMVSGRQDGKDTAVDPDNPMRCTVKGDKVAFLRDGKVVEEVVIKLDPSKNPPVIDSTLVANSKIAPGIYRLEGDTFTLCYAHPGTDRPTDFSCKAESGHSLSVWKKKVAK